ncbi:pectinesterase [Colletotrichum truncatum]|uniref:Pectinesterase n=1 Tax=Colletotrichum truncatum TaxID=5467 RepID=A0ACC3YWU2_COLTU|nr:pectinesterase [Colletotrichum truncatum]KAF6787435.1 pectinesterase [Colletotrichum truncatum]
MPSLDTLYPPLDPQTRSTRLLKFLPQDNDTIRCTLTTHTIDDPPPFIGLSYVWGPPSPSYDILVNNEPFQVRENLWHALRRLVQIANNDNHSILPPRNSRIRVPQYYWIDAICINQEDAFERGFQVDLMKDIFSTATFVMAWLGESEDDVPALFEYLQDLKHTPRRNRNEFLRNAKKPFSFKDAQWLVSRPYWSRIWIVQEFTLARELYILCGSDTLSWPALQQLRPFGMSNRTNLGFKHFSKQENHYSIRKHVNSCTELSNLRRSWQTQSNQPSFTDGNPESGARPTLTRLLAFCKDYQCTDPRDRVYGLLGLTDTGGKDCISADYTISPFELYHRVIFHLQQNGRAASEVFRSRLAEGLQIVHEDGLSTSTFIYETVGSRTVRRLLTSGSDVWREQLLKELEDNLGFKVTESCPERLDLYERIISHYRDFPSEQDPATWATFERAIKLLQTGKD